MGFPAAKPSKNLFAELCPISGKSIKKDVVIVAAERRSGISFLGKYLSMNNILFNRLYFMDCFLIFSFSNPSPVNKKRTLGLIFCISFAISTR